MIEPAEDLTTLRQRAQKMLCSYKLNPHAMGEADCLIELQILDEMERKLEARNSLPNILTDVAEEVERSEKHGSKFASLHEAYAVMAEEMDEVWDITKMKKRDRGMNKLRDELIQVAAMAVKAVQSLDNFVGGDV